MLCPTSFLSSVQRKTAKKEAWRPKVYGYERFFETFTHVYLSTSHDQIYSAKPPPGSQVAGWTRRTCVQKVCAHLCKNGVDIWTFMRETCVSYAVGCNYYILVQDGVFAFLLNVLTFDIGRSDVLMFV